MAEKLIPYIEKNNEIYQVYDIEAHNAINNINTTINETVNESNKEINKILKYDSFNTINYGYGTEIQEMPVDLNATTGAMLGYKREGMFITLNGPHDVKTGASSTYAIKIRLNNAILRTYSTSSVDNWDSNLALQLKPNTYYKACLYHLTDFENIANVTLSVYKSGTHSSIGTSRTINNKFERIFLTDEDESITYNLVLYIPYKAREEHIFENTRFCITLEEYDRFKEELNILKESSSLIKLESNYENNLNYYINAATGARVYSNTFQHSDYVDISQFSKLLFPRFSYKASISEITFYNENKEFLLGIPCVNAATTKYTEDLYEITPPANAQYAIFSNFKNTDYYGYFPVYGQQKNFTSITSIEQTNLLLQPITTIVQPDLTLHKNILFFTGGVASSEYETLIGSTAKANYQGINQQEAYAIDSNYESMLFVYNTNKTFIKAIGWNQGLTYIPKDAAYIAFVFRRLDNAAMTDDDLTAIQTSLTFYSMVDTTLTKSNIAADAATVGAKLAALEARIIALENAT